MTSMPTIFLGLLADRQAHPGAIRMDVHGEGDPLDTPQTLDALCRLSGVFPCLADADWFAGLAPDRQHRLHAANVAAVPARTIRSVDELPSTLSTLSTSIAWLDGNWYLAPPTAKGRQSPSRALALQLMQLVANDADTIEIEAVFRQDPVLAYHLLRLVNSLGMGTGRHVSSFAQAILILGRQQLKRWLNLMLFAASRDDQRSAMLMARVAVRARSMEQLARAIGLDRWQQEQAFMTGMFSLLGVLFGTPLDELLKPLKLAPGLAEALLHRTSDIGRLLQCVEDTEYRRSESLERLLTDYGLSVDDWNQVTLDAHFWMLGALRGQQETCDA